MRDLRRRLRVPKRLHKKFFFRGDEKKLVFFGKLKWSMDPLHVPNEANWALKVFDPFVHYSFITGKIRSDPRCRRLQRRRAAVLLRSAAPAARRLARAQPHVARGMVSETLTLMKKSKKAAAMQRVPHLSIFLTR